MINELKLMLDGLEAIDVDIVPTHKTLTKAGGKEALRVVLDRDDTDNVVIKRLEYMGKEDIDAIWVLRDGNHDHFPDIKLIRPLRPNGNLFYAKYLKNKQLESNDKISVDTITKLKDNSLTDTQKTRLLLDSYPAEDKVNFSGIFPKEEYRKKIQEKYEKLSTSDNPKVVTVSTLLSLFLDFDDDGHRFLQALDTATESTLTQNTEEKFAKLLLTVLYGNKEVKNSGDLQGGADDRVKLVIDYQPDPDVDIYASNAEYYKKAINHHLISLDAVITNKNFQHTESSKSKLSCPIYGETNALVQKKFPQTKLPKIGNLIPYSRLDGNVGVTVHRYHRSGTDAYSVNETFANKLDGLLSLLTHDDNEDQTWRPIASEKPDQNDILIAFCHDDINLPALKFVSTNDYWNTEDFEGYIECTKEVLNLIKAKSINPNALCSFIILRRITKGNQKVVFSINRTIKALIKSATSWNQATANIPPVSLPILIEKHVKIVPPWRLSPEQLVRLSRHIYDRDGAESKARVPAISFSQTMRLFFEHGSQQETLAERLLNKICQQTQWLFNFCAIHKVLSVSGKQDKTAVIVNKNALMYTTLISLLLYKLNRPKEVYMTSLAYQLGQYCSAMNELHLGYCESERGGSIPTTLLGSSAYSIALQSPSRALDYLAKRLKPYESWVAKQQPSKDNKTEKYHRTATNQAFFSHQWMRQHAPALQHAFIEQFDSPLPKTYTAELMLGYLAGRDFEKKSDKDGTKVSGSGKNHEKTVSTDNSDKEIES